MVKRLATVLGLFALLVLSLGIVSAASLSHDNVVGNDSTVNHDDGSFEITFDLNNSGVNATIDWTASTASQGAILAFSKDSIGNGTATTVTESITATISFAKHLSGTIEGIIIADPSGAGSNEEISFEITINDNASIEVIQTGLSKTANGTVTITNTGNTDLTGITLESFADADFEVAFGKTTFNLDAGDSETTAITSTNTGDLSLGDDATLTIKAAHADANDTTSILILSSFCEDENNGDLNVELRNINIDEGFGDDDAYWYPLDKISFDLDVENEGSWDVENIEIKICLLDTDSGKCVIDEDDMDLEDDDFDLDEDDDVTIVVEFEVNPRELTDGNNDYILYAKAIGKVDDSDSIFDGDKTCSADSKEIEIRTNEEFIIIDNMNIVDLTNPDDDGKVSCGSKAQITADVWNVGDSKIDEDKIFVEIYSKDLGINEVIDFQDISSLDSEELSITVDIPEDLEKNFYGILFTVYDDDNLEEKDIYENSEDDNAEFDYVIEISSCIAGAAKPSISASLSSDAKVGEELVITATITNEGSDGTFVISAENFESWAELVSVNPQVSTIDRDDSTQVIITLKPTNAGTQSFMIKTSADGEESTQSVSVSIADSPSILDGVSNTMLYLIVGIAVVLILIVLALIVRISRRTTRRVADF